MDDEQATQLKVLLALPSLDLDRRSGSRLGVDRKFTIQ
jgi:hypothetical protein